MDFEYIKLYSVHIIWYVFIPRKYPSLKRMHTVTKTIATTTNRITNQLLNDQPCCWKSLQPENNAILLLLFVPFSLTLRRMNLLFHVDNGYRIIIFMAFAYDDTCIYIEIWWVHYATPITPDESLYQTKGNLMLLVNSSIIIHHGQLYFDKLCLYEIACWIYYEFNIYRTYSSMNWGGHFTLCKPQSGLLKGIDCSDPVNQYMHTIY